MVVREKRKPKRIVEYARARAKGATKNEAKEIANIPKSTPIERIEDNEIFRTAQKRLIVAMENVGITDKLIAQRIHDLLMKKHKTLSFGKVRTVDKVDSTAVAKALEHIAKVRGDYEPLKVQAVNPLRGIPINELMGALQEAQVNPDLLNELLPEHKPESPIVKDAEVVE